MALADAHMQRIGQPLYLSRLISSSFRRTRQKCRGICRSAAGCSGIMVRISKGQLHQKRVDAIWRSRYCFQNMLNICSIVQTANVECFDPEQGYFERRMPLLIKWDTFMRLKRYAANPTAGINHWLCILLPSQDLLQCSPAAGQLHFFPQSC